MHARHVKPGRAASLFLSTAAQLAAPWQHQPSHCRKPASNVASAGGNVASASERLHRSPQPAHPRDGPLLQPCSFGPHFGWGCGTPPACTCSRLPRKWRRHAAVRVAFRRLHPGIWQLRTPLQPPRCRHPRAHDQRRVPQDDLPHSPQGGWAHNLLERAPLGLCHMPMHMPTHMPAHMLMHMPTHMPIHMACCLSCVHVLLVGYDMLSR